MYFDEFIRQRIDLVRESEKQGSEKNHEPAEKCNALEKETIWTKYKNYLLFSCIEFVYNTIWNNWIKQGVGDQSCPKENRKDYYVTETLSMFFRILL